MPSVAFSCLLSPSAPFCQLLFFCWLLLLSVATEGATEANRKQQKATEGNRRQQQANQAEQKGTEGNRRQQKATEGNTRQQKATEGNRRQQKKACLLLSSVYFRWLFVAFCFRGCLACLLLPFLPSVAFYLLLFPSVAFFLLPFSSLLVGCWGCWGIVQLAHDVMKASPISWASRSEMVFCFICRPCVWPRLHTKSLDVWQAGRWHVPSRARTSVSSRKTLRTRRCPQGQFPDISFQKKRVSPPQESVVPPERREQPGRQRQHPQSRHKRKRSRRHQKATEDNRRQEKGNIRQQKEQKQNRVEIQTGTQSRVYCKSTRSRTTIAPDSTQWNCR